jgi:hypothetical protein
LVTYGHSRRGVATRKRSIDQQCSSTGSQNLVPQSCSWFICLDLQAPCTYLGLSL